MQSMTSNAFEFSIRNMLGDSTNYSTSVTGEIAGNTWSTQMIIDALNFAIRRYALITNATYTSTTIASTQSHIMAADAFDTVVIPSDNINLMRVSFPTQAGIYFVTYGSGALLETSKNFETLRFPLWEEEVGVKPRKWMRYDSRSVRIIPATSSSLNFIVGYIQAPLPITTLSVVSVANLNVGQWYEIVTPGSTDFTDVGATDSVVGTQFQATGHDATTGTVFEIIDPRILPAHQEFLRYSASSYLVGMSNDQQSMLLSAKYDEIFNNLLGVRVQHATNR